MVNISQLVNSILGDLVRLTSRQGFGLLLNLVGGAGGGIAGAGGGFAGFISSLFARQEGGPVQRNRAFLVGERGPELFVPGQSGRIESTPRTAALMNQPAQQPQITVMAPEPRVTVVVVDDQRRMADAIDTPEGEKKVIAVLSRRRRQAREILS